MWKTADRSGIQNKLSEHFGISMPTVYRIRKKLNLPDLHDWRNPPGKRKLYKRIRKLYVNKERSTLQIAKIVRLSDHRVNQILKEQNVTIREAWIHDNRYTQTNSSLTPTKLLNEIKRLYTDEKIPAAQIANELGIDQGTVRTKLKALKIKIRSNQYKFVEGGYKCQWCARIMETVYHNIGTRKQLYCNSSCRNKAKDYRRMMRGIRVSEPRLKSMNGFLKTAWGAEFDKAVEKIMGAKPIIKTQ